MRPFAVDRGTKEKQKAKRWKRLASMQVVQITFPSISIAVPNRWSQWWEEVLRLVDVILRLHQHNIPITGLSIWRHLVDHTNRVFCVVMVSCCLLLVKSNCYLRLMWGGCDISSFIGSTKAITGKTRCALDKKSECGVCFGRNRPFPTPITSQLGQPAS